MFKSNTESYSESWKGIADSTITELDNLQTLLYGGLLQVPLGCPIFCYIGTVVASLCATGF